MLLKNLLRGTGQCGTGPEAKLGRAILIFVLKENSQTHTHFLSSLHPGKQESLSKFKDALQPGKKYSSQVQSKASEWCGMGRQRCLRRGCVQCRMNTTKLLC